MPDAPDRSNDSVLRALHRRIAFVFDFDETLAERTTDALLRHLGVDVDEFKSDVQEMVDDGWEKRFAEAHLMVGISHSDIGPIDSDVFRAVAGGLEIYSGAEEMHERIRSAIHEIDPDIEVEFHLLTAGFVDIPAATSIGSAFDSITGGHWHVDDDGAIVTPKSTVGHYDKVRYIQMIAKGLDTVHAVTSRDVDADIAESEWHVPYEQMIFVADGDSDLPSFDFMESKAGTAIAVGQDVRESSWENLEAMREGRRVLTLLESDYSEGSPLMRALTAAGRRAALWIEICATADREQATH